MSNRGKTVISCTSLYINNILCVRVDLSNPKHLHHKQHGIKLNHTLDFCWELYGKPSAHKASFQVEKPPSQSLPPTSKVVSIPEEEYNRLLSLHSNFVGSDSTATLTQQGTFAACLATKDP